MIRIPGPVAATGVCVCLVYVYWRWIDVSQGSKWYDDFASSVIGSLFAGLLAYLSVWFIYERRDEGVVGRVAHRLRELLRPGTAGVEEVWHPIPIEDLESRMQGAEQVTMLGRWSMFNGMALRSLFAEGRSKRRGTLDLFICDPRIDSLCEYSDLQRQGSMPTSQRVAVFLNQIRLALSDATANEDQVRVYLIGELPNYVGYCFDDIHLFLKPYEHSFSMPSRAPTQRINLGTDAGYRAFWRNDVETLRVRYTPLSISEAIDAVV